LFDALGSAEKTLHANPGSHEMLPSEVDSGLRFLAGTWADTAPELTPYEN
jgi:hypothetical protein